MALLGAFLPKTDIFNAEISPRKNDEKLIQNTF